MKTKKMLISIGIILGFVGLCFAKGTEAIGTNTIEPKLVMEYKFDEPVVDVIFDSATMTVKEARALGMKGLEQRKVTEKVKVQYPKAVFIPQEISFRKGETRQKEIRFYDKKGSLTKKINISQEEAEWVAATSPNKKYILVSREPNEFQPEIGGGGALYTIDGSLVWKKEGPLPVDSIPSYIDIPSYVDRLPSPIDVSDEGYVVACHLPEETEPPGDFVFYDPKGNEIGRIKNPYEDKGTGYCSGGFINKEHCFIAFGWINRTTVILATKEGKILWSKEFDYIMFGCDEFIAKKDLGIAGIAQLYEPYPGSIYACFVDWNGNLKWSVPLETGGERVVQLSEDNEKVYITTCFGYIWCIEVQSGRLLWRYKEHWAPSSISMRSRDDVPEFSEMEIRGKYIYVIGKQIEWGGRYWHSSALFIFDSENGNLIQKIEYPNKRITFISKDNNLFLLDIDAKNLLFFETKEVSK